MQEWFGYHCVDEGDVPGRAGEDVEFFVERKLKKADLWPVRPDAPGFTQDDIFDLIELLYDYVSVGVGDEHCYHSYANCGWHYLEFDAAAGQAALRNLVNEYLPEYGSGYRLSEEGEIQITGPEGLDTLMAAALPAEADDVSKDRLASALKAFRARGASANDRRSAIRELGDILEHSRPRLRAVLTRKDENELFSLLNNFGLRHLNQIQKREYDEPIFLSWVFYHLLASVHATQRLIRRDS